MPYNPNVCGFCNRTKSTVLLGLAGGLAQKILKLSKHSKASNDMIEVTDRPARYLCGNCILTQIPNTSAGKIKALSGKTIIRVPKSTVILFFQDKIYVDKQTEWDAEKKAQTVWLPEGSYQFIRIDAAPRRVRTKRDKMAAPLFPDLDDKGMMEFSKAQGHAAEK